MSATKKPVAEKSTFAQKLTYAKYMQVKLLLDVYGEFDKESQDDFSLVIESTVLSGRITLEEIAKRQEVTNGAVHRWSRGRNLPTNDVRQNIVTTICKMLIESMSADEYDLLIEDVDP